MAASISNSNGITREKLVQRVLMASIIVICVTSDAFLAQQEFMKDYKLLRHLIDSGAHGAVGFCCWGVFLCQTERKRLHRANRSSSCSPDIESNSPANTAGSDDQQPWLAFLKRCVLAGVTASLLDVDHFIAAGSFSISGATHLKHRPFGHAVTFIVAVAVLVYNCSSCSQPLATKTRRVCFVVVTLLSHQLRDGMRLGLWFWPLGSTPPIQYLLYLMMEEALPFVMAYWQNRVVTKSNQRQQRSGFEAIDHSDGDEDEGEKQGQWVFVADSSHVELRVITIRGSSDNDDK